MNEVNERISKCVTRTHRRCDEKIRQAGSQEINGRMPTFYVDELFVQVISGFIYAVISSTLSQGVGIFLRIVLEPLAHRRVPKIQGPRRETVIVGQPNEWTLIRSVGVSRLYGLYGLLFHPPPILYQPNENAIAPMSDNTFIYSRRRPGYP